MTGPDAKEPGSPPAIDEDFLAARQRLLFERVESLWQVRRQEVDSADGKASFLLVPLGITLGLAVNNVSQLPTDVRTRFYWGIGGLTLSLLAILAAALPRKWAMIDRPERLLSDRYRSMAESTLWGTLAKTLEAAIAANDRTLKWKHRFVYAGFVLLICGVVALIAAYLSVGQR